METVYLHIGTHKTGSTSIQRFLARAHEALAEQSILYPKAGRPDTNWSNQYGQHELPWSLLGKRGVEDEQAWRELRREMDEHPGQRVVLSAEGFEACTSDEIRRIVGHLDPHPIRVIVYLRRPLQFLRSSYKQRVKMGAYSRSFVRYVREMIPRCKYLALVNRWEQFEEVESVDIHLFDKVKDEPGLEATFAEAVGIEFGTVQSFVGPPVNTSPPDDLVQIAQWINKGADLGPEGGAWQTLAGRVRKNMLGRRKPGTWLARAARPFLRESLLTERAAAVLREALRGAHERFLKRYVEREDWPYLSIGAEQGISSQVG